MRRVLAKKKKKTKKQQQQITIYPLVVWLKFKSSICDLKFNILPA